MNELRRAYRNLRGNPFKVAAMEVRRNDPRNYRFIVEVSNVRGVELGKLLEHPGLSAESRKRLVELYVKRRADWGRRLRALGYRSVGRNSSDPFTPWGFVKGTVNVAETEQVMCPESIIVDLQTFDMTIIDPK